MLMSDMELFRPSLSLSLSLSPLSKEGVGFFRTYLAFQETQSELASLGAMSTSFTYHTSNPDQCHYKGFDKERKNKEMQMQKRKKENKDEL